MAAPKGNRFATRERRLMTPLDRFRSFCRFEPETGCVVWVGGKTQGRGHHVPYGAFWFEGRRWFAHRWSALHIHGLVIDGFDVDHRCPFIPHPNTLCVEHVQALTPAKNRELQTQRAMIHLQVGLIEYKELFGYDLNEPDDFIPFDTHEPPAWLDIKEQPRVRCTASLDPECPF